MNRISSKDGTYMLPPAVKSSKLRENLPTFGIVFWALVNSFYLWGSSVNWRRPTNSGEILQTLDKSTLLRWSPPNSGEIQRVWVKSSKLHWGPPNFRKVLKIPRQSFEFWAPFKLRWSFLNYGKVLQTPKQDRNLGTFFELQWSPPYSNKILLIPKKPSELWRSPSNSYEVSQTMEKSSKLRGQ